MPLGSWAQSPGGPPGVPAHVRDSQGGPHTPHSGCRWAAPAVVHEAPSAGCGRKCSLVGPVPSAGDRRSERTGRKPACPELPES